MRRLLAAAALGAIAVLSSTAHAEDKSPVRALIDSRAPQSGGKFWLDVDYLYWTAKGDRLPALVTQGGNGALGSAGTSVLFGNTDVNDGWRSGARVRFGYWFDPARRNGFEAHFFALGDASTNFSAAGDGSTVLARPFFNPQIGAQDSLLISSPGIVSGQISISETSRLQGAGGAYRHELCANCLIGPVTGFLGYRYLHLRDTLSITTSTVGLPGGPVAGSTFGSAEQFSTSNDFHGLDLGLRGTANRGPWSLEWMTKIAVGATLTDLTIGGSTATTSGGVTTVTAGDLLAQPTNIGHFSRARFSAVPEASARLGYQITPVVQAFVGYDVMYWTGVVRPGGAIDTTVNVSQLNGGALTGQARPQPQFNSTDYWAHGLNVGVKAAF